MAKTPAPIAPPQLSNEHVRIIRDIVNRAVDDVPFLRRLATAKLAKDTLKTALPDKDFAALFQFKTVIFKAIESTGFCVVPPQGDDGLVVVVTPRASAIRPEMIGSWPEGSSPDPNRPTAGCGPE